MDGVVCPNIVEELFQTEQKEPKSIRTFNPLKFVLLKQIKKYVYYHLISSHHYQKITIIKNYRSRVFSSYF